MKTVENTWDFVASAMGVKDPRPYINVVHVIDKVAYATDGKRLHYGPVIEADGIYNEKKEKISDRDELLRLVSVFRIAIPRCDGCEWSKVAQLIGDGNRMKGVGEAYDVNLSYLLAATAGDAEAMYAVSNYRDDIICVINKFGRAVVMGMRV